MKTTHDVEVTVELEREASFAMSPAGFGGFMLDGFCYVERTLKARVALIKGTRDELEVEWLSSTDELLDNELTGATEKAEELWWNAMESEPSLDEEQADYGLQLYKERREQGAA